MYPAHVSYNYRTDGKRRTYKTEERITGAKEQESRRIDERIGHRLVHKLLSALLYSASRALRACIIPFSSAVRNQASSALLRRLNHANRQMKILIAPSMILVPVVGSEVR